MTIDKEKLKALAEAANAVAADVNITMAVGSAPEEVKAVQDFLQQAMPKTILALLAEIDRLKHESEDNRNEREIVCANYDQLKAENEALRNRVADDERKLDALLNHCDDGECVTCGQIICPHGDGMHFHHDGCPSCAQHDAAMAKEASHDHE
ncbi:MAG: hypothetical protein DI560_24510 [Pseudomonas putida]|uniref:hypothetical protein n=1 Tax=Pseudomonas sp. DC418 TaxID=3418478 RepID=UPI000DB2B332|nr:MAG: hypothetical protein DI560_24510 [Pseudomonas putida]